MRVLIDNDVVLDFLLKREPYFQEARELFLRAAKREIVLFVAAITPINCFYTIRKFHDLETTRESVRKLLQIVKIARVDKSILDRAFGLGFNDYEDAVQCSSAIRAKLEAIITRNIKDFRKSTITTYTPADFIEFLNSQADLSLGP